MVFSSWLVFILPNSCFQLFVSHCPIQCETKSLETDVFIVELCTLKNKSCSEFTAYCVRILFRIWPICDCWWIWGSVHVQPRIVWDCCLNRIWTIWSFWNGLKVPLRCNLKSFEIVVWIDFEPSEAVETDLRFHWGATSIHLRCFLNGIWTIWDCWDGFEVPLRCNLKSFVMVF